MGTKKPMGQVLIILETDLSNAKHFNEEKLTPIQKRVYDSLSPAEQEKIKRGNGAIFKDLDTDTEICSFNMEGYKPPKASIDALARFLADECRKFYSDPENVKKYVEWKSQRDNPKKHE